jgi:3-hydroxyacyl-CoA dehydrogenase/enoyl-CoA hydratase/3-hydroxybutyryl-CoA epimerase
MQSFFGMTLDIQDSIGRLTLDYPGEKVNKLSAQFLLAFNDALAAVETDKTSIRALIIQSAKPDIFIAGADIEEIRSASDAAAVRESVMKVHEIFLRLEKLPFPVIAVINGACLGGGLELALACSYRIATDHPKTKIGLPEVMLGIIPGFGGTQRLTRTIGLQRALPLILTGKALDAKKAFRQGIVDRVVPHANYEVHVLPFIEDILAGKHKKLVRHRKPRGLMSALVESVGKPLIYSSARQSVMKQTHGHYPAPLDAIEAVRRGLSRPLLEGLAIEADYLSRLVVSSLSKYLINIYFLTEKIKKHNGLSGKAVNARSIDYAGVLGAGVMGGGIAQLLADRDIPVRLKDISMDAIALGMRSARKIFDSRVKRKRLTWTDVRRKMSFISGTLDYNGFRQNDVVIEAIVENMDVKKKVLSDLSTHISPTCVVASNTSSLSITEMAQAVSHPERFAGMHFFNPVHRMPLVEVIRGRQTSDGTVATLYEFAKRLGKTPIVVNDGPGFLVNRLLMPYLNEAGFLVEEGCPIDRLDRVMTAFGMPMGPCLLIDEVGIDVAYKVGKIFEQSFGSRVQGSHAVEKLYHKGRLGKKGQLGFYRHGKETLVDPDVYGILQPAATFNLSDDVMLQRMLFPMINEAARCLDESIVTSVDDIDIGMIFGTGFPPFRGGLMRYADVVGAPAITATLDTFSRTYGNRFEPCTRLRSMAAANGKFFQP